MNHNASTVDCNISRFFIQTPTIENSASALAACHDDGCVPTVTWVVFTLASSRHVLRAELARTGTPYRIDWRRAPQVSPAEKRCRPGCANGGSCARTSSGPGLDAGREKSNEVQDRDPCTASKVWCLRPLHTSWCLCVAGVAVVVVRHDVRLQLLPLLACDAGSLHAISRCWQLSWHLNLIPFAPAGSWHATFPPFPRCCVCAAAVFSAACAAAVLMSVL